MAETFKMPIIAPATLAVNHHQFLQNGDWCSYRLIKVLTPEECATIQLPIEIYPKDRDYISAKNTENLKQLMTELEEAPQLGYYATLDRAKLAISSMFGVWFEIRCHGIEWEAFRVA